ncbi:MAG: rhodanese-like domain-containing protein [Thiobacillus sp.]
MGRLTELLNAAHACSQAHGWPFMGGMRPPEAHEFLQLAPGARLIDVRSRAELDLSGVIPGAVHVEWQSWPGWVPNPDFLTQIARHTDPESLLLFISRNQVRASRAAAACAEAGRGSCYTVLEGFEGELNPSTGHRSELNGWKFHGLPWRQA